MLWNIQNKGHQKPKLQKISKYFDCDLQYVALKIPAHCYNHGKCLYLLKWQWSKLKIM